jgi:hypothetical protein
VDVKSRLSRVVLESAQVGGSRVVTEQSVRRFLDRLAAASMAPRAAADAELPDDAERAERELAGEWDKKPDRRRRATAGGAGR